MSTLLARRLRDKLVHKFNPDLGPGRIVALEGRRIVVEFPKTGAKLTYVSDDTALVPVAFIEGQKALLETTGEEVVVKERASESTYLLEDGRVADDRDLWPLELPDDPLEKLAHFELDRAAAFRNRVDGLFLKEIREARGLGSFLGGRIELFPHQLHVAERATLEDPVRWLLADEVGLGKTIEACLILSRLVRTERAYRVVVVAPSTLTVQWLGELYRKFHQTFVLLDKSRREDVAKEHGEDFNVFEAHDCVVIAIEDLVADPRLPAQALESGIDLLVVDEAHRLERARGDAGNDAYRAIAPMALNAEHLLLLTAIPLEADTHGFFRLLELVRPDAYKSEEAFLKALEKGKPLPPCTSATRRVDIGGLPPRVPIPIELDIPHVELGLTGDEEKDRDDARLEWLVERAPVFAKGGAEEGKTLIFCHDLTTLTALKARLETATQKRVAIFHEELTPERRDLEVAEFRRPEGPSFLVSTEAGGEGRNFEFCRRLVLFDLPSDPAAVEQRIGRLDRISRKMPVEIVYFRPPSGFGAQLVALYERMGLFREPLGGLERSLAEVAQVLDKARRFADLGRDLPVDELVDKVREAAKLRQSAAYHHLHAQGYRKEHEAGILERIPKGLDSAIEKFTLSAADLFGFETARRTGRSTWYVEFGSDAIVEHVPGIPFGTRFLGTFAREEAVFKEDIDFFASGHALVEGLFQELEDGPRGRTALVKLEKSGTAGEGLLFVFRNEEAFTAEAISLRGVAKPEWAELLLSRRDELRGLQKAEFREGLRGKPALARDWPSLCRALAARVPSKGRLLAVAAFRLS